MTQNFSNIILLATVFVKPVQHTLCERRILAVIAALVIVRFARQQLVLICGHLQNTILQRKAVNKYNKCNR